MFCRLFGSWINVYIAREDKGDREGIPHTHPTPQVIRLELFLKWGRKVTSRAAWMFRGGFCLLYTSDAADE